MQDKKSDRKTNYEKKVLGQMVQIYCRDQKHLSNQQDLCIDCQRILDYAHQRVNSCPVLENKSFCSVCTIHCYQPKMREEIQKIMRCAGPKMIFHHPITALKHLCISRKPKKKN